MTIDKYKDAYVEVLEILNYLKKEDYKKIPKEYIIYFQNNINRDYIFKYDISKTLKEQRVLSETKLILFFLFEEFGANDNQRKRIKQFKKERMKNNKLLDSKYIDLFKDTKKETIKNKELIVVDNNSLFCKIKDFIKKIIKKQ